MARGAVVTLLTDFGLEDPYVGIMKGVLLSINPGLTVVDITHAVPPGDLLQGGIFLQEAYPYFPEGSVHVAVVDPGVGGSRRPMAFELAGHFFVGPDNGLFWPVLQGLDLPTLYQLDREAFFLHPVSATFHGRDVFAPVAAHLSLGTPLEEMGSPFLDPQPLHIPRPRKEGNRLVGEIVRVDHFGNLVTNIHRKDLEAFLSGACPFIRAGKITLRGLSQCYGDVAAGAPLALLGSSHFLEISVNRGRAGDLFPSGARLVGEEVVVERT